MTKEIDAVVDGQHPLDDVCNSSEDIWGQMQTKRKSHVHILLLTPHHAQEGMILRVDCYIAMGVCHIKLSHEGPMAPGYNVIYKGVDSDVVDQKWVLGDAVIKAVALQG